MNSEQTGGDGTRYDGRRAGRNLAEPNPYLQILFTDCSGTVEMFSAVQEATLKPSWAEEQFRFFLSDSEDAASMQVCMYILLLVRPPIVARVRSSLYHHIIHCGGPETRVRRRARTCWGAVLIAVRVRGLGESSSVARSVRRSFSTTELTASGRAVYTSSTIEKERARSVPRLSHKNDRESLRVPIASVVETASLR